MSQPATTSQETICSQKQEAASPTHTADFSSMPPGHWKHSLASHTLLLYWGIHTSPTCWRMANEASRTRRSLLGTCVIQSRHKLSINSLIRTNSGCTNKKNWSHREKNSEVTKKRTLKSPLNLSTVVRKCQHLIETWRSQSMIFHQSGTFKDSNFQHLSRILQIDERRLAVRKSPKSLHLNTWLKLDQLHVDHRTWSLINQELSEIQIPTPVEHFANWWTSLNSQKVTEVLKLEHLIEVQITKHDQSSIRNFQRFKIWHLSRILQIGEHCSSVRKSLNLNTWSKFADRRTWSVNNQELSNTCREFCRLMNVVETLIFNPKSRRHHTRTDRLAESWILRPTQEINKSLWLPHQQLQSKSSSPSSVSRRQQLAEHHTTPIDLPNIESGTQLAW